MHRQLLAFATTLLATGCGTYAPHLQSFPPTPDGNVDLAYNIIASIKCELSVAVGRTLGTKFKSASESDGSPLIYPDWLRDWVVSISVTLDATEDSKASPSAAWSPNPIFNLAGGFSGQTKATRKYTQNITYKIDELEEFFASYHLYTNFSADDTVVSESCKNDHSSNKKRGSILITTDLKFYDAIESYVRTAMGDLAGKTAKKSEAFKHEISFETIMNANINPRWTFSDGTINGTQSLFSVGRTKKHQLLAVFGPTKDGELVPSARDLLIASRIASSLNE